MHQQKHGSLLVGNLPSWKPIVTLVPLACLKSLLCSYKSFVYSKLIVSFFIVANFNSVSLSAVDTLFSFADLLVLQHEHVTQKLDLFHIPIIQPSPTFDKRNYLMIDVTCPDHLPWSTRHIPESFHLLLPIEQSEHDYRHMKV